jgi:hypothetical protein
MMNRPLKAAQAAEKDTFCFAAHFKLLFLFSPDNKEAGGNSCLKTAVTLRQAAKSIYLIPPIFRSQNTGAIRLNYLILSLIFSLFRCLHDYCQEITAQCSRLSPEHQETCNQIK